MELLKFLSAAGFILFISTSHLGAYWLGIKHSETMNSTEVAEKTLKNIDELLKEHEGKTYSYGSIEESMKTLREMLEEHSEKIHANDSIRQSVKIIDDLMKEHIEEVYIENGLMCAKNIAALNAIEGSLSTIVDTLEKENDPRSTVVGDFDAFRYVISGSINGDKCLPERRSVRHEISDPSISILPRCTRLFRCGGCCESPKSCQPTEMISKNVSIRVSRLSPEGKLTESIEHIFLDEHISCRCNCIIKPENCTGKQRYVESECRCECPNVEESTKCGQNDVTERWDAELCACR